MYVQCVAIDYQCACTYVTNQTFQVVHVYTLLCAPAYDNRVPKSVFTKTFLCVDYIHVHVKFEHYQSLWHVTSQVRCWTKHAINN